MPKDNKSIELSSKEYLEYLKTLKEALSISENRYKSLIKKFHIFMDNVKNSVVSKNKIMEEILQNITTKEAQNITLKGEVETYKIKATNLEKKLIQKEIEIDELKINKNTDKLKQEKKSISTIIKQENKNNKDDDFIYLGKK